MKEPCSAVLGMWLVKEARSDGSDGSNGGGATGGGGGVGVGGSEPD